MKKIMALLLAFLLIFGLCSCGGSSNGGGDEPSPTPASDDEPEKTEKVKVGFIYLHDEQSTYDLNFMRSAKEVCEAEGVEYIQKVGVNEDSACLTAAEELVDAGCTLVFADSFGHQPYMIEAAKEFPDVEFVSATGDRAWTEDIPNFHNAFASIYDGRYLAGVVAGMKLNEMIENGEFTAEEALIGYVGAKPYEEVYSGFTSFYLGARSICPTARMEVTFTGEWYDETLEKEAAQRFIDRGAKLISQHADSMGAPTACENAGVPNVSYNGSTIDACPNTFLVSSRINWTPYMTYIVQAVKAGKSFDTDWCGTLATGSVALTDINEKACAAGTAEKLEEVRQQLMSGEIHVYDTSTFTVTYVDPDTFTNTSATMDADGHVTSYMANCVFDDAYTPDTEVVEDGYIHESEVRSAPYFYLLIDGITIIG